MAGAWGAAGAWEFAVLEGIQGLRGPLLDQVMVFVTNLSNHGEVWLLLGILCLCFSKTRYLGLAMILSIGLGYVTGNLVLKNLFARSRPCWIRQDMALLIPVPLDYSFPSGHTLVSFEGAVCVWRRGKRWGIAALGLAAVIAFSRMYLFVHFPTDILAGLLLGIANGWCGDILAGVVKKRMADSQTETGK